MRPQKILLAVAIALGAFWWLRSWNRFPLGDSEIQSVKDSSKSPIVVFCAASNRAVMDAIRDDYEKASGIEVQVQYGASQTLLASIEVSGTGDLYLPADDSYLELARKAGRIEKTLPLAIMRVVVAVPRGNPKEIRTFADLLRSEVRLVQANPDAAAIGKLTRDILSPKRLWKDLQQRTIAFRSTVTEVANDVQIGAAEAGIVFDAVLYNYPELQAVSLPELDDAHAKVAVGLLSSSRQSEQAWHFANFLASPQAGQLRYAEFGFQPVSRVPGGETP
jgi:molybdate transport system substrate-binding protein